MILYEAFIDICIFKLTFYEAFLTIAMQKYREGCTFSSKISASRRRNPTLESASGSSGSRGSTGNGVTTGRSNPGNRAHAFRMTLVVQGNKLPQMTTCKQLSHSHNPLLRCNKRSSIWHRGSEEAQRRRHPVPCNNRSNIWHRGSEAA